MSSTDQSSNAHTISELEETKSEAPLVDYGKVILLEHAMLVDHDKQDPMQHHQEVRNMAKRAIGLAIRRQKEYEVYNTELRNPRTIKREKDALLRKLNASLVAM